MGNIDLLLSKEEQALPEAALWRVLDLCGIPFRGSMQDIFAQAGRDTVVGDGSIRISPSRPLIPSLRTPLELGCIERDWVSAHRSVPQTQRTLDVIDPQAPLRKICGRVTPETDLPAGKRSDPEQVFPMIVSELSALFGPANGPGGFSWEMGLAKVGVQNISGSLNAPPHVILSFIPEWRPTANEAERLACRAPLLPLSPDERLRSWRPVDRFDRVALSGQPKPGVWLSQNMDYVIDVDRQNRLRIIPMALIKRVSGQYLKIASGGGHLVIDLEIETIDGKMRLSVYDLFWDSDRLVEIDQAGRDIAARLGLPFSSNRAAAGLDK